DGIRDFHVTGVPDVCSSDLRTVCYFISEWITTHQEEEEKDKGYERLEHPPGEAQVDFGLMEAVQDGELVDIHALVMSFPHSNARSEERRVGKECRSWWWSCD